jgi:CRP/FNR family transcriptional regulator
LADTKMMSRIDVLADLAADEIDRFVAGCRRVSVQGGERVFSEGDEGDEVFIVRTGRVRIAKAISLDASRTLAVVGPGGIFGELAMVDAGPRSATAEAVEASEVLAIGRDSFQKLVAERSALGAKMLGRFAATLAERLRFTNDLLRDTVAWGLDVSGAAALNLQGIIKLAPELTVALSNGREIVGKLLKVERGAQGLDLTLKEDRDDRLYLIPYHAIVSIAFPGEHLATRQSGEV